MSLINLNNSIQSVNQIIILSHVIISDTVLLSLSVLAWCPLYLLPNNSKDKSIYLGG